ncbi:class I SAM-dependent methyltransferase [Streptomyces sp. AC512_CC834]|uniref:class I SAM-dependent methyltransferase n=1 Tax=Streptomyces sp. AC512_CC834 TaxID=2823691 RepID=UPI001C2810DB|nr:class I SAM-dependent methyltransferase [Streptomyces sp. AC512_CC834]
MPILPREQPEPVRSQPQPQPQPQPHQARQTAESFGTDAERYDRARPGYPEDLVARVVDGSPGPDVLDVGCGTGIAARQFQAAGCAVLGIEPDARMADLARARGLPVEVTTFEAWEPAGRTFDALTAAQSWHWVDPVAGAAKAARVLRPDGRLTVFGHVFEPPAEVAEPFAAACRRVAPGSPFSDQPARRPLETYRAGYAKIADTIRETGRFDDPEQWRFDWERSYTRDQWLDLLPTTGGLTRLSPGQLAGILGAVGDAVDALGGRFTMHYTTLATTAVRAGTR